jgi:hypothetical protein
MAHLPPCASILGHTTTRMASSEAVKAVVALVVIAWGKVDAA